MCRQLDDSGPQQGLAADKIAVDAFCPRFSKGFHIFETATVTGTFVLTGGGSNAGISSIASDRTSCHGVDGYSGLSGRIGADHLGHAKVSMTQDRYMSRGRVHTQVADLLDRAMTENDE